ncbi:Endosome/lysosome-associated apoptosis and autophagy regulator family member 2 [Acropora cervicornis]|uniref:Endosome/lysosome-associated apoptosis and autophagy regulator family member 2 n=1 Tax=Acropora cervicornis TaxID=6130 RepID=A0AAD9Q054_ACRCE|nr:Endosome/lysosome-associated apoptosis and autophagy regulator family member 2 [Acropora cervicornis]
MASATLVATVLCLLLVPTTVTQKTCTRNDYVRQMLPCDEKTLTRSVVYYLNSNCTGGDHAPVPTHRLPCYCPQGKGLASDGKNCASCKKGEFGSGGEVINNWNMWTENGTKPPERSDMVNYCEFTRPFNSKYVCNPWKASVDNYTLESGEHSATRCVSSVLLMTKKFIQPNNNKVSFDYRVDSRYCRGVYYGCDGLAFFVNNKMVLDYSGSRFQWTTLTYNLKPGTHTLKWVYHKSCYSYAVSFVDKAFIRSITLVGTEEPNISCTKCPPGYYSKIGGASNCTACSYFEYQSKEGQQQCDICPQDTYSMLGASKCLPLPNCTDDDIIKAPDNLDSCSCTPPTMCRTTVVPSYVKVRGFKIGSRLLCKNQDDSKLKPQLVQCRCQPGYEIVNSNGKKQCHLCDKGSFSTDGIKCARCEAGHVALRGKHFYVWRNNTLPHGFFTDCFGDCSVKGGWIPAGGDIRTERVVGDLFTVLNSPEVEIVSELGKIMFICSVTCNLTGVAPKGTPGEHLSKINDCNLIFQVLHNDTLREEVNCTYPRGGYQYRHEWNRDGRIMTHILPLKKGRYSFRWIFHQQDETLGLSTAFEGKVYNISIVGTKEGSALNCTPCPAGYHSSANNTDCAICPNGTASKKGSEKCTPCDGNSFAAKMGSETCMPCGENTTVYPGKDGCDTNDCKFTPAEGVEYDLSALSREDGPMVKALLYRVQPRSRRSYPYRTVIWPYRPSLYFNLCTLKHDNSSCLGPRNMTTGQRDPLPVMACRSSWGRRDTDIGSVIGYRAKKDVRSGLYVDLLHGDLCYYGRGSQRRYQTTLDLRCNIYADVGNPGPENNRSGYYFKFPCGYYLVWESLYACPKCQGHEVEKVVGECINGTRNVTSVRSVHCWGTGRKDEIEVPIEPCPVVSSVNDTIVLYHTEKSSGNAIKIVIGVCVPVILVLLGIVLFFVYRHRTMKYRYFNSLAREKPMSRLAEEDELDEEFNESSPCSKT